MSLARRSAGSSGPVDVAEVLQLVESFGADRLVLGTDLPYEAGDIFVRAVDYISAAGLPVDQAEAILEHNTTRLLGIGSA